MSLLVQILPTTNNASLQIEICVISYRQSQNCLPESVNTSSIISSELNPSSRLTVCTSRELFKFPLFRLSHTSRIPPPLFTLP
jgi:hypothetical protein